METVRTTCPYCGVGCGVLARPDGGPVAGDAAHPASGGRLCSKGSALAETTGLADRLLHPEVNGRRASWDAALDTVAEGFRRALASHGPEGTALYVSGQLLTEDYYAANKLAKAALGTANIDSNSRLCMASAVAAHTRAFGEDLVPGIYEDLELADLVVLVGSNLAWCHPVLYQRLAAARAARPEMKLIVLDPRRTASCEGATLHLPLRPGSDVALFAALLVHLHDNGFADAAFLASRTEGLEPTLQAARAVAAEAPALTGLAPSLIQAFCSLFARHPKVVTLWSQGVNQSSAGTDKANALINCHLLTGRIGAPGMGPFSITGQPNAMGGREVGALATMLAAHLRQDRPEDVALLRDYWRAPALPEKPGLKAVDLFGALAAGRIGALWVMGTNPAVSLPRGDAVRAALRKAPFLVVSENSWRAETLDMAHVRLPALSWGEKDGTVTNSERVISRQRRFLPPPGEARQDWWILAEVAKRLGHGGFAWNGPADIFREHATLSGLGNKGTRRFDISALAALDDAGYDAMPPTRWPCPADGPAPARLLGTEDQQAHRLRFVATPFRAPAESVTGEFPLRLMTGRLRDQWHTMTRTGAVPRLMAQAPEPLLTLNPGDAPAPEGSLVQVESPHGKAVLRLKLDPGMQPGCGFVPMHWTARFAPAARVNASMGGTPDPVSGQPELKHVPFRARPFAAGWHGFLIAQQNHGTDLAPWCAVSPVEGGWRHELAGRETPAEAFARLRALLPEGEWMLLEDTAAGLHRAVLLDGDRLAAAIAVAPEPALPPRDWLASLLTGGVPESRRAALLAGRPVGGPPPSPTICVCHGVREDAICGAIRAGACSVAAIGEATRAGTNCGACRPEIAALLARVQAEAPAAESPVPEPA